MRAKRAMAIAVDLAPDHRIVLRSQARLLVHFNELDKAHELIRRHPRTVKDVWLMATEIALAHMRESPSLLARAGSRIATSGEYAPEHITELAAVTGIVEAHDGGHRRARKLFELSLAKPTDNVLAQLQHLDRTEKGLIVTPEQLRNPHAMEARTWRAWKEGRWSDAVAEAIAWQLDEPFSTRPAVTSSAFATSLLGNAQLGIECAEEGLRSNPDDQLLRNNLAFALVRAGRHADALQEFRRVREPLQPHYSKEVFYATSGLMAYLRGDIQEGRRLYELAMKADDPNIRRMAALSWLETEIELGFAGNSALIRAQLDDAMEKIPDQATKAIAARIRKKLDEPASKQAKYQIVMPDEFSMKLL
jgi:tetratricopeptide (TPR) repeat protein